MDRSDQQMFPMTFFSLSGICARSTRSEDSDAARGSIYDLT